MFLKSIIAGEKRGFEENEPPAHKNIPIWHAKNVASKG